MSDLPNWIKAVDKSFEVTDEELKEINELTNKLKQAIREKNVEKIKRIHHNFVQYAVQDWIKELEYIMKLVIVQIVVKLMQILMPLRILKQDYMIQSFNYIHHIKKLKKFY